MGEAELRELVARKVLRPATADPETARAELDTARRHVTSAETILDDDPSLAFTALDDAMRKAISAHMRSRGHRTTSGPGAHVKSGQYAQAALDHLDITTYLDEFDALRNLRNQTEYDARHVDPDEVRDALDTVRAIVAAIANDL